MKLSRQFRTTRITHYAARSGLVLLIVAVLLLTACGGAQQKKSYRIGVLTGAGSIGSHSGMEDPDQAALLAMGDPDGSLPGAKDEVEALSGAWGQVASFTGEDVTKTRLRIEARKARILHLATHGYLLSDNPEGSYLLLAGEGADGKLGFHDIKLLPLSETDVAVLSACETAMGVSGEGSEIVGLAYQFELRGASTVVASLWKVSDASTQALMLEFYQELGSGEVTKAEALRRSQLKLLEDEATSHPFHWAPFILIGDWR